MRAAPIEVWIERFFARGDGCWEWQGNISQYGYGKLSHNRRTLTAHRAVYEVLVGPIPAGMALDHLCRNRACVNPAHLEPVTMRENILRGAGLAAENAVKTQCKRGHALSGTNMRLYHGKRICRECARLHAQWVREAGRVPAS